jgi:tetratricopeptide (TPR) repeat protein
LTPPPPSTPWGHQDDQGSTDAGTATGAPGAGLPAQVGRYPILGLIGRGGMGVVYCGLDASLQRPLAVKVLLAEHAGDDELRQRFLKEAQIMGQLQHPGVAPIHEIGELADGRPFFSMKQIQGQTLAALLQQRRSPTDELPTYIGIFGQVCQTLAYAHARHILHRDLKPDNIMVGAFGEVQVMDWGLAKVLPTTATANDTASRRPTLAPTATTGTAAGTVLGTPAYMAPEQARGEVDQIDECADVFGLGAILCEILTGAPPFAGGSMLEVLTQAAAADLADALARLQRCGADGVLIVMCRRCLAPAREHRLAHAGAVAEAVATYQAQVQQRLQQAQIDKAAAQVKATEERKRRRVSVALLALALAFVLSASAAAVWYFKDQAERTEQEARDAAEKTRLETAAAQLQGEQKLQHEQKKVQHKYMNQGVAAALDDAARPLEEIHRHLADAVAASVLLSDPERQWKRRLDQADLACQKAALLAGTSPEGLDATVQQRLAELSDQLKLARQDWERASKLDHIRLGASVLVEGKHDRSKAAQEFAGEYARTFAGWDMDFAGEEARPLASKIANQRLRYVLVAALDHWAEVLALDAPLLPRILETARLADPDRWRDQIRNQEVWQNPRLLTMLAMTMDPKQHNPQVIHLLAFRLTGAEDRAALLRRALLDYPQDFWLHFDLGFYAKEAGEQAACYQAALAIRPDSHHAYVNLGAALAANGDLDGAIAATRKAIAIDAKNAIAYSNLAVVLKARGDLGGAIAELRKAIDCNPKNALLHNSLALDLHNHGDLDGAIAAYHQAIACDPRDVKAHNNLAAALKAKGDLDGAIATFRQAIAIDPKSAFAHNNLGLALKNNGDLDGAIAEFQKAVACDANYATAHIHLGNVLCAKGDLDGAIAAFRQAIACDAKNALAHFNLGNSLQDKGDMDGAIAEFRQAIGCDPKDVKAHNNLGLALHAKGDLEGAIAAYRLAIACDPKDALVHDNLGMALQAQGDLQGAVAAFRQAIACNAKHAQSHVHLAFALLILGDWDGAIGAYNDAIACNPRYALAYKCLGSCLAWHGSFQKSVDVLTKASALATNDASIERELVLSQRLLELDGRLPEVVSGKAKPANRAEALEFAFVMLRPLKKHYALALKLYSDAFAEDKTLEENHRFYAACAAVQLAAGRDPSTKVTAGEAASLRKQAHQWLSAQVKVFAEEGKPSGPAALQNLKNWLLVLKWTTDLAPVRDAAALERLPADECQRWQQLWAEVDQLLTALCGTKMEVLKLSPTSGRVGSRAPISRTRQSTATSWSRRPACACGVWHERSVPQPFPATPPRTGDRLWPSLC